MHDGESLTFTGAILRHGARARGVTARFNRLASRGRSQLLAFLRSL